MKRKYDPDEHGIWEVRGEDPNADFGGHHHNPLLGHFEGRYRDIQAYAEVLPRWKTWGAGGQIEKIIVVPIDEKSIQNREKLLEEQKQLKERLEVINKTLGKT